MSWVYIISDGTDIKIGKANNPTRRLSELQTGNKNQLSILRLIKTENEKDAYRIESTLHKIYSQHRLNNEWFKGEIFADIQQYSDEELHLIATLELKTEQELINIITNLIKTGEKIYFINVVKALEYIYPTFNGACLRPIVDNNFIFNDDYSLGIKNE